MITVAYDKEVDITYVKFTDRPGVTKKDIDDSITIEIDRKNWLVSLEFLGSPAQMFNYIEEYTHLIYDYSEVNKMVRAYR